MRRRRNPGLFAGWSQTEESRARAFAGHAVFLFALNEFLRKAVRMTEGVKRVRIVRVGMICPRGAIGVDRHLGPEEQWRGALDASDDGFSFAIGNIAANCFKFR